MEIIIKALVRVYSHPNNQGKLFLTTLRLAWWMINRRFFKLKVIAEMLPGAKLICDPSSSYGSLVFYNSLPEYAEQMFMHQFVQSNDTIIDIGAHIGSETVLLGSKLTAGRVYSFEPTPSVRPLLIANVAINNLHDRVVVEDMAVSDHVGSTKFYLSTESEVNSLHNHKGSKEISVKTTTIDSYVKKLKIDHIHLLKIDVEGHELAVISGTKQLLTNRKIDVIVFEVNDQSGSCYQDNLKARELLIGYGYKLYLVREDSKLANYVHYPQVHNCIAISPKIKPSRMKNIRYE